MRLYKATDHGHAIKLDPEAFAPAQRGGGWGPFVESFLRMNEPALGKLGVTPTVASAETGVSLSLVPGARAGAIPLRSAQTGHVVSGMLIEPRFGWSGVGRLMTATGWAAAPEILDFPLVPGSGREVPPWVLGGPVLQRLRELLAALRPGYRITEEVRRQPRGQIVWNQYIAESFARGRWGELPCRFPDLAADPLLRRIVRWALERVRGDIAITGGRDTVALLLLSVADELLGYLRGVLPLIPTRAQLELMARGDAVADIALRRGLEALGWIADERGLGGGREMDGLAWAAPLEDLWERFVEADIRRAAALKGGIVRVGRARETLVPLEWTDPGHRTLGHLLPDIVVTYRDHVEVVDAKYKAHLAELDESGWRAFTQDARESHRADLHQILAYAALFDAPEVHATLVFPLRAATWQALAARGRDRSTAEIFAGRRRVKVELRGLPFGGSA